MNPPMLSAQNLAKRYGQHTVLADVTLELDTGNVAVFGANGAGKSTLTAILAGMSAPDAGTVRIDGIDLARDRVSAQQRLAYVPDKPVAYPFMTGRQFLEFVGAARGYELDEHADHLAREFAIDHCLDVRFDAMSLGLQRKHFIVAALCGNARVIVMDEPTNGLDEKSQIKLAERLRERSERGLTLFATHDVGFAERVGAKRVMLEGGALRGHGANAVVTAPTG